MLSSFSSSDSESRRKFIDAATKAAARLLSYHRDDLRGKDGEALACDVAVLGDPDAAAGALVVSGTHGAEGYCGAAILHRWLTDHGAETMPDGVKVVLVHAINPWAFSHKTRATENNVDLNRNFLPDSGFSRVNHSYDKLAPYLHGSAGEASDHLAAFKAYNAFLGLNGLHIENESMEGQSRWPEGIFYTGAGPEWSNTTFRWIVKDHLGQASKIGFIDWHTCLGRFGEIVHLVFDAPGSEAYETASDWWRLNDGGGGAFKVGSVPRYDGLLSKAIGQELSAAKVAGAVIEYGTVDDYSVFRADRLDRWLRFEGRDDPEHDRLREDYLNVCCPTDVAWRRFVLASGPKMIDQLVAGVGIWGK